MSSSIFTSHAPRKRPTASDSMNSEATEHPHGQPAPSTRPAQHLQGACPHGPPSCTLASPAIPSTSLWGSAEPTPDNREEPQERGVPSRHGLRWDLLRSPVAEERPVLLCRVGACFCCQEDHGVKSLQHAHGTSPAQFSGLSGPICSSAMRTFLVTGDPWRPNTQPPLQPCCPSLGCFQRSLPTASRGPGKTAPLPSHSPAIRQPPKPSVFSP